MNLGVLGSLVWDRIHHPASGTLEGWGGISYSLAAAAAARPQGWTLRPIIKLGGDLAASALAFLRTIPGLRLDAGIARTTAPQNRVELEYQDEHHRHECLTGGAPAWTWDELEPRIRGLDALYVNLISGLELELETARRLRDGFGGFIYADIHSLLLAVTDGGHRRPRPLADRDQWLRCFDAIQVNEAELALLSGEEDGDGDGESASHRLVRALVADGARAVLVTRGGEGATWFAPSGNGVATGSEPIPGGARVGDPTGCGDVWGATCFMALMRGDPVAEAARAANHAAALKLGHQGAEGLYAFLEDRL